MAIEHHIRLSPGAQSSPQDILKGLVHILHDGKEGYRSAASDIDDGELKELFCRFSLQRSKFAGELETLLLGLGEDNPEKEGTTWAGDLHRGWMDLKAAVTRKDRTAILTEVERGEQAALKAYSAALDHRELPAPIFEAITRHSDEITTAQAEVEALRKSQP